MAAASEKMIAQAKIIHKIKSFIANTLHPGGQQFFRRFIGFPDLCCAAREKAMIADPGKRRFCISILSEI